MKATLYQVGNYRYCPIFRKDLSQSTYTQRKVYHIFTDNPKWCVRILEEILGDNSMSKGERDIKLMREPNNMLYNLAKYHTCKFIDRENDKYRNPLIGRENPSSSADVGYYEYVIITPYDD